MKTLIFFFLLILFYTPAITAQDWSEPVLISTMNGYNDYPDFCIDNSGVIHCVWSHKIATNFFKIYYSKSTDNGNTWTDPEDISQNDTLWMCEPHIASDNQNNLYVSYDYNAGNPNATKVLLRKYNGTNWSLPDTITPDMPSSMHNRIVIDHNNRIYVFWFFANKIYYKFLQDGNYSDVYCPYNTNDFYFIDKAVVDSYNNLHCIGAHHNEDQSGYDDRVMYFKYDYSINNWEDITIINNNRSWQGTDITLDNNQLPNTVWGEYTTDTPPYNDATLFRYFNGTTWSAPEIVVEDPKYQTIAVDNNNRVHIVDREKNETGNKIVYYRKLQNSWEGEILDETYAFWNLKLLFNNDNLFLVYTKIDEGGGYSYIVFRKYQIPTGIPENTIENLSYISLEQNYPNPFNKSTNIHFKLNKGGKTTLKIFDLQGKLIKTLINKNLPEGEYDIIWDGANHKNEPMPAGIYLYRLQVNKRVMTRSLIIN